MNEFVRWGMPWLAIMAVLYLIHRYQARRDHMQFTAEERWRQRMDERYWQLEFEVEPVNAGLAPEFIEASLADWAELNKPPFDWEQADAMDEAA